MAILYPAILESPVPTFLLFRVAIAVNRHHDHGNSYRGTHLILVAPYSFRDWVHYYHGGEHGSREYGGMQANMV